MKKISSSVIYAIIIIMLIVSCSKKNQNEILNTTTTKALYSQQQTNPLDYVGIVHNGALDAVANAPVFPNLQTSEIYNIISTYVQSILPNDSVNFVVPFDSTAVNFILNGGDTLYSTLLNLGFITNKQYQLLIHLSNIIENPGPNEGVLLNKLEAFVTSVINRNDMTDKDKEIVLGSVAIAQHSVQYWSSAFSNPANPWHDVINPDSDPPGMPKWIKKVGADIVGFGLGGSVEALIRYPQEASFNLWYAIVGASIASGF